MINFIRLWKYGNALSIILIIISIFALFKNNLNFGIDFTGGILIEIHSSNTIPQDKIVNLSSALEQSEIKNIIQLNGTERLIIKLQANESNKTSVIDQTKEIINKEFTEEQNLQYEKIDFIGSQISQEFFVKSSLAVIISLIGIMIYLLFRFNWRYALGGILGLIHDVLITFGFISLFKIEVNMMAVTAILTTIGYSINDSVIIYDRIREILKLNNGNGLKENINLSLNNTLTRTIFTSTTTLLSTLVLIIFGGKALYSFSIVVFIGILVGTYSSIFIASQFLVYCPQISNKKEIDVYRVS